MRISKAIIGLMLAAVPAAAQPVPTATEIFELRGKCQKLAQKLLSEKPIEPEWDQSVTSNYSIRTYHCYALFSATPSKKSNNKDRMITRLSIYDAHTKDLLAVAMGGEKQSPVGWIFDAQYKDAHEGYSVAKAYIEKLMETER